MYFTANCFLKIAFNENDMHLDIKNMQSQKSENKFKK